MITDNAIIARLWDDALDLGFRSSSISFVEMMVAEHRLQNVVSGRWDPAFSMAEGSADYLRQRINDVHPNLYVVHPNDVQAEVSDPAHILINTRRIPGLDARHWARCLSNTFDLDVEKATASTLLLLCASPEHALQLNRIIFVLKESLKMVILKNSEGSCDPT